MHICKPVYYNCVKFHLNPMSRLGGVVLTSPSRHTERISEYKLKVSPLTNFGQQDFFMKLYTFVMHYLQMCMKKYGRCPKFGRGDNSTISPYKFWTATIFLHAHL
jgi:hypothetical protein